ncbi:CocE/NonD family hydrolase C-terminal non-catalytic domain-containing protein [Mesorhizobium sp. ORM6]
MDRTVELPPGSVVEVTVPMMAVGYEFPAEHRIRLAVSTAYWPFMWPHPVPAQVALNPAGSALALPVRNADAPSEPVHFEPPKHADALPVVFHPNESGTERQVHYNPETMEWRLTVDQGYGGSRSRTYPDGLQHEGHTAHLLDPFGRSGKPALRFRVVPALATIGMGRRDQRHRDHASGGRQVRHRVRTDGHTGRRAGSSAQVARSHSAIKPG